MGEVRDEDGFSLMEVMFAVGLLTFVIAGSVGAFAMLAKRATPEGTRDLAMIVAQNTLVRARAAAAYAPNPLPASDVAGLAAYVHSRTWALAVGRRRAVVPVKLVAASAICGQRAALELPLTVDTDYEEPGTPPAPTFSVTVTYPVNACEPGITRTVSLSEELPPVAFVPGTRVTHDLVNPPWGQ